MVPVRARVSWSVTLLLGAGLAQSPDAKPPETVPSAATGFLTRAVTVNGAEHRYVVYAPRQFRAGVRWPLVMFLHGADESGTDGARQTEVGLGPAIRAAPDRWPFFVVFPQKPTRDAEWRDHDALVMATLAATEQQYPIDATRRYLTGLAQGGAGTWELGAKHATTWAALAPVCGHGKPAELVERLRGERIWAFHGVDDRVVPAQQSKDLCAALELAGTRPVLTLLEHTGHDAWDTAYRESALAEWLRMVVTAPALAAALARPETSCGTLTVHVPAEEESDGADAEHGAATATCSIALTVTSSGAELASGSKERDAVVRLTRAHGQRLMAQHLRTLCRAGLLELPPGNPYSSQWPALVVDVECEAGRWLGRADLRGEDPHGRHAAHCTAVAGVAASLRRLVARR